MDFIKSYIVGPRFWICDYNQRSLHGQTLKKNQLHIIIQLSPYTTQTGKIENVLSYVYWVNYLIYWEIPVLPMLSNV